MESLYYLTLRYLRKNPELINFKELNHQTRIDMFKVIENKNHMRKQLPCRSIYNLNAIYNYIAFEYRKNTDFVQTQSCTQKINTRQLEKYLGGTFVCGNKIYDRKNKLIYSVIYENVRPFEYTVISIKFTKKYSDILGKDNSPWSVIHDEEFFKNFPGLLDAGVKANFISERMLIDMDAVKKHN